MKDVKKVFGELLDMVKRQSDFNDDGDGHMIERADAALASLQESEWVRPKMRHLSMNEIDRVGYFLDDLQEALPLDSNWYCHTNRCPDYGAQIQRGTDGPVIALFGDGTWTFSPLEAIADEPAAPTGGEK